jgi:hypothetical protein
VGAKGWYEVFSELMIVRRRPVCLYLARRERLERQQQMLTVALQDIQVGKISPFRQNQHLDSDVFAVNVSNMTNDVNSSLFKSFSSLRSPLPVLRVSDQFHVDIGILECTLI